MSEEDSELERLKAKRLAEMQKNISIKQKIESAAETTKETVSEKPRDSLIKILGFRGLEVLENAESQFPNETKMIVGKLSELIKTGEINESLDGGKLLALFRSVGLNVRMATKINVEQDGKFVSLSDKLSNQTSGDE
ncbi:MAG: DNA-binding protein [Nitrosopumilus sp.]|nr:DNA-binding protein [Nitrosopumilus sp.]MDF2425649.1 DNA-binding protein [Nitrosopumilus sp.]MDF2427016.1 DNA-binding protein [Nitrosopumilus sp.]MDF2428870.1 DNA-binding protein [Nitrosopumilus sp.]MDF2429805.1 DNA-binding protein [Nitrosopumilus sp.]